MTDLKINCTALRAFIKDIEKNGLWRFNRKALPNGGVATEMTESFSFSTRINIGKRTDGSPLYFDLPHHESKTFLYMLMAHAHGRLHMSKIQDPFLGGKNRITINMEQQRESIRATLKSIAQWSPPHPILKMLVAENSAVSATAA